MIASRLCFSLLGLVVLQVHTVKADPLQMCPMKLCLSDLEFSSRSSLRTMVVASRQLWLALCWLESKEKFSSESEAKQVMRLQLVVTDTSLDSVKDVLNQCPKATGNALSFLSLLSIYLIHQGIASMYRIQQYESGPYSWSISHRHPLFSKLFAFQPGEWTLLKCSLLMLTSAFLSAQQQKTASYFYDTESCFCPVCILPFAFLSF